MPKSVYASQLNCLNEYKFSTMLWKTHGDSKAMGGSVSLWQTKRIEGQRKVSTPRRCSLVCRCGETAALIREP